MAYQGENNDVPVRSPISVGVAAPVSDRDEEDFSTIVRLLEIINEAEAECGDMNIIDPSHPKLNSDQQVVAYQFALNKIILPLKSLLTSTINDVQLKQGES